MTNETSRGFLWEALASSGQRDSTHPAGSFPRPTLRSCARWFAG